MPDNIGSLRLAYADPPYPGKADRYAENEEVDHVALIEKLLTYDGWALSTDERSLRYVLALCPETHAAGARAEANRLAQIAEWLGAQILDYERRRAA